MKIFAEMRLSEVLESQRHAMLKEVQSEPSNKLLNVNESDYVNYLVERYRIDPLVFAFNNLRVSHAERMIPANKHPSEFHFAFATEFPRQVLTFHLPFDGEADLLKCQPSSYFTGGTHDVDVSPGEIRFELINWRDAAEELKRGQEWIIDRIRKLNANVTSDVAQFNSHLEGQARQAVASRKAELLKRANIAESLGIPLLKSPGVPQTFAVPVTPKRLAVKPSASDVTYSPQPTLDDATYQDILSILHDAGVGMERLPSTYANKQEEDLRDYLLIPLCTHYPNTTGETFNKKGKTDILIRHEGSNVFVAECKFWKGMKGFHETIDQLLGYLTWRDSKAAIVCFVNNNELNPVLDQIRSGTTLHPCFVRLESKKSESWTHFELRLRSDATRNVHLAVLCFHFPPS